MGSTTCDKGIFYISRKKLDRSNSHAKKRTSYIRWEILPKNTFPIFLNWSYPASFYDFCSIKARKKNLPISSLKERKTIIAYKRKVDIFLDRSSETQSISNVDMKIGRNFDKNTCRTSVDSVDMKSINIAPILFVDAFFDNSFIVLFERESVCDFREQSIFTHLLFYCNISKNSSKNQSKYTTKCKISPRIRKSEKKKKYNTDQNIYLSSCSSDNITDQEKATKNQKKATRAS